MSNLTKAGELHKKIADAINEAGLHDFEVVGVLTMLSQRITANSISRDEEDGQTDKEAA